LLIVITVVLFYWKLVFTKQFSVLWQWEPVTQSYSWYHFAAAQLHRGILPIWDPYRFSGNTFIGEMQTGLFYPLKFFAYVMPLDKAGLFSERLYNQLYVVTHILAAIFMFFLARHLRLSSFSSFISAISFALGGYIGNTGHPHTLDSAIWLPWIVLFFLKAIEERGTRRVAFFVSLAGFAVGMAILGGGLHMVVIDAIVISTMSVWLCRATRGSIRMFAIAAVIGVVGFLFGAVQLLPSMEYAPLSYRWVGGATPIRALQKVPYQYAGQIARFSPRAVFTFLFGAASPGDFIPTNYFGVLPLFLSIIGAWKYWREPWVKYWTVLAVTSFAYSWGDFSLFHGLLYLVPGLDVAREAARFIQATHFAMALLAGYGVEHLFSAAPSKADSIWSFIRAIRWLTIFVGAILIAASLQTSIAVMDQAYLSFVFIACAYIIFELVCRNYRSMPVKSVLVFLLLWDVYAFGWFIRNKGAAQTDNPDYMAELMNGRKLAEFFQSQRTTFRVHFDADFAPNIGDVYGVPMTAGMAATMLTDYSDIYDHPQMAKLLNVRYTIRRTDLSGVQKPVYTDGTWRVYENPNYGSRAWVVHEVEVYSSKERLLKRLKDPDFDPSRMAMIERPLSGPIDPRRENSAESVTVNRSEATSLEFHAETKGRGLLVASEVFYPGWQAFVNGHPAPIYRIDGGLRGVMVPEGNSLVQFEYRPVSFRLGLALSAVAFIGTVFCGLLTFHTATSHDRTVAPANVRTEDT
jgi:hypothetical protein